MGRPVSFRRGLDAGSGHVQTRSLQAARVNRIFTRVGASSPPSRAPAGAWRERRPFVPRLYTSGGAESNGLVAYRRYVRARSAPEVLAQDAASALLGFECGGAGQGFRPRAAVRGHRGGNRLFELSAVDVPGEHGAVGGDQNGERDLLAAGISERREARVALSVNRRAEAAVQSRASTRDDPCAS